MDWIIIGSIIGASAFLLILVSVLFIIVCCLRRKRNRTRKAAKDEEAQSTSNNEERVSRGVIRGSGDANEERIELQALSGEDGRLPSETNATAQESVQNGNCGKKGSKRSKKSKKNSEKENRGENKDLSADDKVTVASTEPAYAPVLPPAPGIHTDQSRDRVTSSSGGHAYTAVSELQMTNPEHSSQFGFADYEPVKQPATVMHSEPAARGFVSTKTAYSEVDVAGNKSKDGVTGLSTMPVYEPVSETPSPTLPPEYTQVNMTKKKKNSPKNKPSSSEYETPDVELVKRLASMDQPAENKDLSADDKVTVASTEPAYAPVLPPAPGIHDDQSRDRVTSLSGGHAYTAVSELQMTNPEQSSQFGFADYEPIKQPATVIHSEPAVRGFVSTKTAYSEVNVAGNKSKDGVTGLSTMPVYEPVKLSTSEPPVCLKPALPQEYAKVDLTEKKKKSRPSTDYETPDLDMVMRLASVDQPAVEYAKVNMRNKLSKTKSLEYQDEDKSAYANVQEVRSAMKELGDDDDDDDAPPEVPPFLGSLPAGVPVVPAYNTMGSEMKGDDDEDDEVFHEKKGSKRKRSEAKEKAKKEKTRKDSEVDKKKKEEAKKSEKLKRNDSKGKRSSKSKKDKKVNDRTPSLDEAGNKRDLSVKSSEESKDSQGDENSSFPRQAAISVSSHSFAETDSDSPERKSKKHKESSQKDKKEKKKWWKSSSRRGSRDVDDDVFGVENERRGHSQMGQEGGATPGGAPVPAYAEVKVAEIRDKEGGQGATGGPRIMGSVPDYEEVNVKKNKKSATELNYAEILELPPGRIPVKTPSEYADIDHDAKLPYDIDYSLPTYMNTQDWVRPAMPKKI